MKTIEIQDELYAYIASQTKDIGESASEILYRLLMPEQAKAAKQQESKKVELLGDTENAPVATDLLAQIQQADGQQTNTKVELFLHILSKLYQLHTKHFRRVLQIKGANRLYFAQDKETLAAAGKSINAKLIPQAGVWVVTNNNTAKKVSILLEVMGVLGYSEQSAQRVVDYFSA